eukprot:6331256-Prymnesium_polylepis.1
MSRHLRKPQGEGGNSRGNEARRLGEEIDEKLVVYEASLERLGAAARQKKSRARKADGADVNIRAIDEKLANDRAALAAAAVVLERLPDAAAKIEVKRERPPAPPKPPPRLPTTADIAKLDDAVDLADADVVAVRRR